MTTTELVAREALEKVLVDNIDFSDYGDNQENTVENLYRVFKDEYFHENELRRQKGSMPRVISEWLRGLPSVLSMPFYTFQIVDLMYALGYDTENMEPIDVDNMYWEELGEIIYAGR